MQHKTNLITSLLLFCTKRETKNLPLIGCNWLHHNSITYGTKGFHGLDSHQPPHCRRMSSKPGQSIWNFKWTKWQWYTLFFQVLWFSLTSTFPPMIHMHSFTYHQCHIITATGGVTKYDSENVHAAAVTHLWSISMVCITTDPISYKTLL